MANMQNKATLAVPELKQELKIDLTQLETAAEMLN